MGPISGNALEFLNAVGKEKGRVSGYVESFATDAVSRFTMSSKQGAPPGLPGGAQMGLFGDGMSWL